MKAMNVYRVANVSQQVKEANIIHITDAFFHAVKKHPGIPRLLY